MAVCICNGENGGVSVQDTEGFWRQRIHLVAFLLCLQSRPIFVTRFIFLYTNALLKMGLPGEQIHFRADPFSEEGKINLGVL